MRESLPSGPREPALVQTVRWWKRSVPFFEHCRARYGNRFTIRLLVTPPFVHLADPDQIKEVYTAAPEVLHPGEGAKILEPIVGRNSVILLDERDHLTQRKLMLPAFHGDALQRLQGLMREIAEQEVARWPRHEPVALHPRLQALTLELILRMVFGLDEGARLDRLRHLLTKLLDFGARPTSMLPPLQRRLYPGSAYDRFVAHRDETDELLRALIEERRAEGDGTGRGDVLTMLLAARHEDDGSPMTYEELRDELMTLLVAGHETTASELAWAFEALAREPQVRGQLIDELDRDGDDAYLTATVQETLRRRPVLPNTAPRLVKQPITVGDWNYPVGCCLVPNAYLVHHDPAIYPDPYAFRPERFLASPPGTYTWIPFGGGRRRCLGASFALLEMKVVLAAVLRSLDVSAPQRAPEGSRRRAITLSPRRQAIAVLAPRAA